MEEEKEREIAGLRERMEQLIGRVGVMENKIEED